MGGSRGGRAFSYQAPDLVNQLPVWIREEEDLKLEARAPYEAAPGPMAFFSPPIDPF